MENEIETLESQVAELTKEREALKHDLMNILARIHRDGGHYVAEHGLTKAVDDAEFRVCDLLAAQDSLASAQQTIRDLTKERDSWKRMYEEHTPEDIRVMAIEGNALLEQTIRDLQNRDSWAKNMISHYLALGLLPKMSSEEAVSFIGKDGAIYPNPYDKIAAQASTIVKLRKALQGLLTAHDAMDRSNATYNPFNKDFVRPWPEYHVAAEKARGALASDTPKEAGAATKGKNGGEK